MIIANYSYPPLSEALKCRAARYGLFFFMLMLVFPLNALGKDPSFTALKKTIAIDPGHGGNDQGATGTAGTLEKQVALSFSNMLKKKLEPDFNVLLTRTDDYFLDISSRAEAANRAGADVMISIHTGGNFTHGGRGILIYSFKPVPADDTAPGAESPANDRSVPPPAWSRVQEKYMPISGALAKALSETLAASPVHPKITVSTLPLTVLSGADMPAILIELGNLSHPNDEKNLSDAQYVRVFSDNLATFLTDYLMEEGSTY